MPANVMMLPPLEGRPPRPPRVKVSPPSPQLKRQTLVPSYSKSSLNVSKGAKSRMRRGFDPLTVDCCFPYSLHLPLSSTELPPLPNRMTKGRDRMQETRGAHSSHGIRRSVRLAERAVSHYQTYTKSGFERQPVSLNACHLPNTFNLTDELDVCSVSSQHQNIRPLRRTLYLPAISRKSNRKEIRNSQEPDAHSSHSEITTVQELSAGMPSEDDQRHPIEAQNISTELDVLLHKAESLTCTVLPVQNLRLQMVQTLVYSHVPF